MPENDRGIPNHPSNLDYLTSGLAQKPAHFLGESLSSELCYAIFRFPWQVC